MEIEFEKLKEADLIVDCIYKGGTSGNQGDDVLSKLLHCGNSGGFRKVKRRDGSNQIAYVVLFTTMSELEWPDFLDEETGIFRYYGDNRKPGNELHHTHAKGNLLLKDAFDNLHAEKYYDRIPPFFVFKREGTGRDVKFLGLAAPGNPRISPDKDLVAFWRTMKDNRFQNYEAYFTILDTGDTAIRKEWINKLVFNPDESLDCAPNAWKKFVKYGRSGIKALKAPKVFQIPTRYDQLQSDNEGNSCLEYIRKHYELMPTGFEACAKDLLEKMDTNFVDFELTRPWRDGGRDAIGLYTIKTGGKVNPVLKIDCALEAKCYSPQNSVGVKQMSRLISRIRYRQFGVMITTSYVDSQAYREVVEDGHPILIVTASDIAAILRNNAINHSNIDVWLDQVDKMIV